MTQYGILIILFENSELNIAPATLVKYCSSNSNKFVTRSNARFSFQRNDRR